MASGGIQEPATASSRLLSARREAVVLAVLITAVMLLIWKGSLFFNSLRIVGPEVGPEIRLAGITLTLNVALILFGWRRYVDLHHEAEKRLEQENRATLLATTDQITGLYNRKGFADRAAEICEEAGEGNRFAIISFQIQRFKAINDQHGHETGDRLLKSIAGALQDQLGDQAIIARLSGDEFAVALTLRAEEVGQAEELADVVLRNVTRPFMMDERVIQVGAFAGIASAPAAGANIPDILRRADIALSHARSGRVARAVWFDAAMERALIAQGEIEQGIRYGLEHGQFVPFFEPQVDLATGEIVGFEVLARWNHTLSGVIGPDVFIPVADEIGLIGTLSEEVITKALREAAAWDPSIKISVNISPSQFADGWVAQRILRILAETSFPAERLVVEVTESSLFADIDLARTVVTSLKNQGVRLALDDFGTGFSSLAHIRSLPFDIIKIDRSFVANIHSKRESAAIIRAVTTLAAALSVPVCVEGIENRSACDAVSKLGCQIGQGWYFGKPMTREQARELLASSARDNESPRSSSAATA